MVTSFISFSDRFFCFCFAQVYSFICLLFYNNILKAFYTIVIIVTRVVTKINGHGDKRSSEIITLKTVKGFHNNIKQPNVMISIVYIYFVI